MKSMGETLMSRGRIMGKMPMARERVARASRPCLAKGKEILIMGGTPMPHLESDKVLIYHTGHRKERNTLLRFGFMIHFLK